ncbi:PAS domain S-box protein [Candidatus Accumulibacter sp. ACC003]|uniref:PAS domain S-box protein n=1 Tax=Candidatus Accumulibacter sp. ACC003 TaxID=2823334 RepID=UPI00344F7223
MSEPRSPTSPDQQPMVAGTARPAPAAHFSRYLAAGILCVNLVVAGGVLFFLDGSRRDKEEKAQDRALSVLRLISKDVDNQYRRIDVSLRAVAEEHAGQLALGRVSHEDWLARVAGRHPALNFMRIADAAGEVIYSPGDAEKDRANVADRDYFVRLRDDPQAGLEITAPLLGRTSGKMVVVLARRLADRATRFDGVVVASIPVDYLSGLLGEVPVGPQAYVGLLDSQLNWVASTAPPAALGASAKLPLGEALRQSIAGGAKHASLVVTLADVAYLLSYVRSDSYGFYTVLAEPRSGQLADWRHEAWLAAAGVALFALLSSLLGLLLSRNWRQHAAATAILRERDEWIRQAERIGGLGLYSFEIDRQRFFVSEALYEIAGIDAAYPHTWAGWLALVHADDRDALDAAFKQVLASGRDLPGIDYRIIRPLDGRMRWVRSSAHLRASAESMTAAKSPKATLIGVLLDISEQKRDEEKLRESEADLSAAVDQAAAGIAFVAPDGRWLRVNDRLCEIVAYPRAELLTLRFQDITHPDDLAIDLAQLGRVLRREIDSYTLEKRYIRKDRRCIWINLSVSLIFNDDGTANHFVSIIEDIDARKSAERELGRTRELLRSFLDHLPGLAYIKDQSLRMVHVNRRCHELLHLDPEDVIGKTNAEIFPGERGEAISARDRQVLASGKGEIAERSYGGNRYQSIRFVIKQNDDLPLLGGITIDVTARYKLEQRTAALLEINERGGTLPEKEFLAYALEVAEKLTVSGVGFLHFIDDEETIALSTWSAGALQRCSASFDTHYPISQAGIWADCCREKRAVMFNDYAAHPARRGLPDGHSPLLRLISVPVLDDGAVRMIVGVGNKAGVYDDFDVTTVQLIANDVWNVVRRGRAEAALSLRLAEVTELKDQLEQAHLQLLQSEKMSAIGQLAAGVAHELNNPIGFVYSNLGTLADYVDDLLAIDAAADRVARLSTVSDDGAVDELRRLKLECDHRFIVEDLPKLIAESKEGLERVRQIVIDLKDFSRVGEVEWQWADLEQGLDSTINIVWNELKYKADVERHYAGLPPVNCLPAQLNQVFMNLLVNAAQAIETHGTIVIRTGSEADAAGVVSAVWVAVEDSGRGMSDEVQKRLFEPFFTTKPIGQGTGLGLSIAFGIVARHHGRIDVASAPGRGSTFRISLPIDGAASVAMSVA